MYSNKGGMNQKEAAGCHHYSSHLFISNVVISVIRQFNLVPWPISTNPLPAFQGQSNKQLEAV